jgi:hypothetical protein
LTRAPLNARNLSRSSRRLRFMCAKQHLDFLAPSAGLLEALGVGRGCVRIPHCLVNILDDLAPDPVVQWGFNE